MKKILFCVFMLAFVACQSNQPTHRVEPLRVGVLQVNPSSELDQKNYVGTIEEERSAALGFALGGTLQRVLIDEGASVQKGQVLAELDPTSARQTFDAAQAQLKQAQDAYARLKKLYDAESLPEIKWVEIQTQLRKAEAAFELANKNLRDCVLCAPFAGVVGKRHGEVGETVLPSAPVVTLMDISSVKVRFAVPEQEIAEIDAHSHIQLQVVALGEAVFEATKPEKGIVASAAAHTYKVRATVANKERRLLPGMVCRVTLTPRVLTEAQAQVVLPLSAVRQAGNDHFVWLVKGDSVSRHSVRLGRLVENGVVITSGLEKGDLVVIEGIQKISQGSKVVW